MQTVIEMLNAALPFICVIAGGLAGATVIRWIVADVKETVDEFRR